MLTEPALRVRRHPENIFPWSCSDHPSVSQRLAGAHILSHTGSDVRLKTNKHETQRKVQAQSPSGCSLRGAPLRMFASFFQSDVLPDTTLVFLLLEKKKKHTQKYLLSDNQDVYIRTDARLRSISCRHILPPTLFKHQPATIARLLSCSLISGGFFFWRLRSPNTILAAFVYRGEA